MANEHLVLCGNAELTSRAAAWQTAPRLDLNLGRGRNDVHLSIGAISQRMCADLPDIAIDLLEVAAFTYAADQAVTRGGTRQFDYGAGWYRRFRFEVPVRCPEVWSRQEVRAALAETLGFLSDDHYEFAFSKLQAPRPISSYLFDPACSNDTTGDFEEVMLFSGGLDSLGGAVQEILQGRRKVALVSHRPVSKVYARQQALVNEITSFLAEPRLNPLHVAVEVNMGQGLSREFTQRSRSFLFASLAAVVASLFKLNRIRFYENGIVSLNLPISPQVVGGRATRTTHPRVLAGFGQLFGLLFDSTFRVDNPFSWKTKAQILTEIRATGYGRLCAVTSSCVHTRAATTESPHCGRCSQCVDRRLSALAAGLSDEEDPPCIYRANVLTSPCAGEDLTLAERYVGTATRIDRMGSPTEFFTAFAECFRALQHTGLPVAEAAQRVFKLHREHANGVCRAVQEAIIQHLAALAGRNLPANCLLRMAIAGEHSPSPTEQSAPTAAAHGQSAVLTIDEELFEARLAGRPACFLGNTIEFRLLARLNRRPGAFVSLEALQDDVWDGSEVEKNTVQRTVSNLRRHLANAGFNGVVIDGRERGHYRLTLQTESASASA